LGAWVNVARQTGGRWNDEENDWHINTQELQAILLGLQALCSNVKHSHIRIRSDNTSAIAYVSNMGGQRSKACHDIAKDIWLFAEAKDLC
jgi:hypothetical protein